MYKRKTYDKRQGCIVCGKIFKVRINKEDGKIRTKCFYSLMSKHYFTKWGYIFDNVNGDVVTKMHYKNWFWRLVGLTTVQRYIVYEVWKLFYGRKKIEYWECGECIKR